MRTFVFTLVVVGLAIIVVVGGGLSLMMESRRRQDLRRRSAREAAARFRRRFGSNASRAVERMLERTHISHRKRRFFKLIESELRGDATPSVPRSSRSRTSAVTQHGTQM